MKRMMLLTMVLVTMVSLMTGCRWMTEDNTTDSGDNSSVGDSTAGSTPLPTATLPTVTTPSTTDGTNGGNGNTPSTT